MRNAEWRMRNVQNAERGQMRNADLTTRSLAEKMSAGCWNAKGEEDDERD